MQLLALVDTELSWHPIISKYSYGFLVSMDGRASFCPYPALASQLEGYLEACWSCYVQGLRGNKLGSLLSHFDSMVENKIPPDWECVWFNGHEAAIVIRNVSPIYASFRLYEVGSRKSLVRVAAPAGTEWDLRPRRNAGRNLMLEVRDRDNEIISTRSVTRGVTLDFQGGKRGWRKERVSSCSVYSGDITRGEIGSESEKSWCSEDIQPPTKPPNGIDHAEFFLWGAKRTVIGAPKCPECQNLSMRFLRVGERALGHYVDGADCDLCGRSDRKKWYQCESCQYDLCTRCAQDLP